MSTLLSLCGFDAGHVVCTVAALLSVALLARPLEAVDAAVVSNVKVVSDRIEDVSSIEAWKAAVLRPGITDREKAIAIWETVVKFRHQNQPPWEYLQPDGEDYCVHDAIKTFNVYGYGMCCCAAADIESLARAAGMAARGRAVHLHSLPEILWDGKWHMFDASLINYFTDDKGDILGIDQLVEGVTNWYKEHPEFAGADVARFKKFMRAGGWKKGPAVLAHSEFYDEDGWLPAGTHGWFSAMGEYDGSVSYPYEYPYSEGYRVNVQLREGEALTRNWSNLGLHVDAGRADPPGCMTGKVGEGDLVYAGGFGDLASGRIGNGTLVYNVPLSATGVRQAALAWKNLSTSDAAGAHPSLHVADASSPGVFVLRMPSPYVYLSGRLTLKIAVGKGGSARISLSRNNGLDWTEISAESQPGRCDRTLDLTPLVRRLYDYRLKFEFAGEDTGLEVLRIEHDVQHSQRALPALGPGENGITFSADPQEGTITIEALAQPESRGNQLAVKEFHPELDGTACTEKGFEITSDGGTVTFAVETPGDVERVRFGCFTRTTGAEAGWDLLVSFDNAQTWKKAGRAGGMTPGAAGYATFQDVPAGARRALVRYAGGRAASATITCFRIDADYAEPNGGFRPVKISYVWQEGGDEKRHVHIATSPEEHYAITCSGEAGLQPVMESVTVELAQ